jgi:disulfide bond formation protein DsbB
LEEIFQMKRLLFLITVLFLISAVGLTACGGGGAERLPENSSQAEEAVAPAEEAASPTPAGDAAAGKEIFDSVCSACHGLDGKGVEGLGKDFTTSEFVAGKTDEELVEFIKVGRDPSDPLNTTGVAMPPKAGNPALTDEDLLNVVAFVRTLQQ